MCITCPTHAQCRVKKLCARCRHCPWRAQRFLYRLSGLSKSCNVRLKKARHWLLRLRKLLGHIIMCLLWAWVHVVPAGRMRARHLFVEKTWCRASDACRSWRVCATAKVRRDADACCYYCVGSLHFAHSTRVRGGALFGHDARGAYIAALQSLD